MTALATVAELKARCDWTFDDDEERVAEGYLEEASDLARSYGRDSWEPTNVPRMAKNLVIGATRRFMRNPDGFVTSRAGDETVTWNPNNPDTGSIYFTRNEQRLLRTLGGRGTGLQTAGLNAWKTPNRVTQEVWTVPVSGYEGEKAFPYFSDETEPW
jgi:hypothetical protein